MFLRFEPLLYALRPRPLLLSLALFFAGTLYSLTSPSIALGFNDQPLSDPHKVMEALEIHRQSLFSQLAPSVVLISSDSGFGSGVFVKEGGLILTNVHVVGGSKTVEVVLYDGRTMEGTVIEKAKDEIDLALVRIDTDEVSLPTYGSIDDAKVGSWVGAIGHGVGAMWTFNVGMVSNIYPDKNEQPIFQTQIPLNPGNSGGPIFNRKGHIIGIVTSGINTANNVNFAISIDVAFKNLLALGASAGSLQITAPPGAPIFLDDQMVGVGPTVSLSPSKGAHVVFAMIEGRKVERNFSYPESKSIDLQ